MFKRKNVNYQYYPPFNFIRVRILALIGLFDSFMQLIFGHLWNGISLKLMFWELQSPKFDLIRKDEYCDKS